ncbi:MAG: hypothetical protein MUQ10_16690, partial [Anaerolineae bacterium]|nr:hypothetical protein [Anaerolineae bacterium]
DQVQDYACLQAHRVLILCSSQGCAIVNGAEWAASLWFDRCLCGLVFGRTGTRALAAIRGSLEVFFARSVRGFHTARLRFHW